MRYLIFVAITALLITGIHSCQNGEANDKQHRTWMDYGGGPDQSKYFIQDQITKENVGQLQVAWSYSTGDQRSYQNNPIIVDTIMYVMAKDNSLVALNATNGKEIWIHTGLNGISRRGITYWENKDRSDRRIIFTLNNTLQEINALTGQSILTFGNNGIVDLRQDLGRAPEKILRVASLTPGKVFEDLIIMGSAPGEAYMSSPGHIRAYNVVTGKMAWIFHTIPQPGEEGYDTWPKDAYKYVGGVNCWSEISIDTKRGIAYIPLGSPTYDYYGADRVGQNLFGNCLLALDARTGKRIWHYQTVHHDVWDYDLASAPQLLTVNKDGKQVDAVAVATKHGFVFVLNRETGEPVWPIEERPVIQSTVPGEKTWPTQPVPAVVPPFTRQTLTENDISNIFLTDEEFASWKERVAKAKKGLFTPLDTTEVITMPGAVGGANWGNTASDPGKGIFYILTQEAPSFYKLQSRPIELPPAFRAMIAARQAIQAGQEAFTQRCQGCHGKDLEGSSLGPALSGMADRLSFPFLRQTILYGTGRMPPILHIEDEEINNILAFLKDKSKGGGARGEIKKDTIQGPVVASGGAPAPKGLQGGGGGFDQAGSAYPEGVEVPSQRYYTDYGLGSAFIVNPPWSSIVAYDLNTGKIKWKKPIGEDQFALAKGYKNTGVPTGTQRNGMIITSNGIIFATVANGQLFAYDADNGDILWSGQTPLGISGLPSMYEANGRIYLVVNASTPQVTGWNQTDEQKRDAMRPRGGGAYWVYALPEIKKK